jgi:hypothetical protein
LAGEFGTSQAISATRFHWPFSIPESRRKRSSINRFFFSYQSNRWSYQSSWSWDIWP